MSGRLILSIESSCDETGIALIEDGRTIRANVVASQVALHAPSGGIVPEVAARAHLRWIVPVLDEAWADAGATWDDVEAVAVTYGPGSPVRCWSGSTSPRRWRWVHDRPLVGVNHLEGHVYAAWLHDPGTDDRPDPVFPLVTLVVSGGHTFLVEMRDHLTYRLLGRPSTMRRARRSTRSGGCSGWAIRADRRSAGQPPRRRATTGSSRAPGSAIRTTSASRGLKTAARRIVTEARADAGLADTPEAPLPDDVVAELAWGFQDAVVDVLATKTIRAAQATGACSIVLGGGVAANGALRTRLAGEAEALGHPPDRAAARPVHRQRGDDRGRRRAPVRGGERPARSRRPPVLPLARGERTPCGDRRVRLRALAHALRCAVTCSAAARLAMAAGGERGRHPARRSGQRPRHSPRRGPPCPPRAVAELPGRSGRARRDPGRGGPGAGPARPRDRTGSRAPHRRACSTPGPPSPRSSSITGWRRFSRRSGSPAIDALRLVEGDALDQDLTRLVEPPYDVVANLPYHITSPILHRAARCPAASGAPRADGPARGRRTDRRAARRDELPVGVRAVPRPRPDRLPRPGRGLRAGARGRVGGDRGRAVRRRRPARPGGGGRAVAAGPGGVPRATQDDPQRPVPPAAARRGPRRRAPSRPPGSTRTAGRRRSRSRSGWRSTMRSARSGRTAAVAAPRTRRRDRPGPPRDRPAAPALPGRPRSRRPSST